MDPSTIERVARAIYEAHIPALRERLTILEHVPVVWDNASGPVREWVRVQAEAAINAALPVETETAAD